MDTSIKKLPIGLHGRQCIGPCYPAKKRTLHPITLQNTTNEDRPFCHTMEWYDKTDNENKWIDTCLIPDKDFEYSQMNIDYVMPSLGINSEYFLKSYYDVYSFEGAIDILTNTKMPYFTQLRLLNCAWKVYGINADVINDQLINFYMNLIKKEWIKDIYPYISKYIYVNNKEIYLKENDDDIQLNQVEKINYFNKKFNNPQMIYKMISSYINENKSNWNDIIDHNKNIESYFFDYIINKIKYTINNV